MPGVEVAYLSASDITMQLGQGGVHFGVTGEDLVRESIVKEVLAQRPGKVPAGHLKRMYGRSVMAEMIETAVNAGFRPATLQQLVPFFGDGQESRLRLVFLSGDWIPVSLPDRVRSAFPRARVMSLGGADKNEDGTVTEAELVEALKHSRSAWPWRALCRRASPPRAGPRAQRPRAARMA